jgi:hypothetical protein
MSFAGHEGRFISVRMEQVLHLDGWHSDLGIPGKAVFSCLRIIFAWLAPLSFGAYFHELSVSPDQRAPDTLTIKIHPKGFINLDHGRDGCFGGIDIRLTAEKGDSPTYLVALCT